MKPKTRLWSHSTSTMMAINHSNLSVLPSHPAHSHLPTIAATDHEATIFYQWIPS